MSSGSLPHNQTPSPPPPPPTYEQVDQYSPLANLPDADSSPMLSPQSAYPLSTPIGLEAFSTPIGLEAYASSPAPESVASGTGTVIIHEGDQRALSPRPQPLAQLGVSALTSSPYPLSSHGIPLALSSLPPEVQRQAIDAWNQLGSPTGAQLDGVSSVLSLGEFESDCNTPLYFILHLHLHLHHLPLHLVLERGASLSGPRHALFCTIHLSPLANPSLGCV